MHRNCNQKQIIQLKKKQLGIVYQQEAKESSKDTQNDRSMLNMKICDSDLKQNTSWGKAMTKIYIINQKQHLHKNFKKNKTQKSLPNEYTDENYPAFEIFFVFM